MIDAAGTLNGPQICVLIPAAIRIVPAIDQGGAVDDPVDYRTRPSVALADEVGREPSQVEPSPSWSALSTDATGSVVHVEPVDVDPDPHASIRSRTQSALRPCGPFMGVRPARAVSWLAGGAKVSSIRIQVRSNTRSS